MCTRTHRGRGNIEFNTEEKSASQRGKRFISTEIKFRWNESEEEEEEEEENEIENGSEYLNHFLSREQGEEGYSNAHRGTFSSVEFSVSFDFRRRGEGREGFVETRTGTRGELTVLCRDNWRSVKKRGGEKRKKGKEKFGFRKGILYRPVDRPQAGSQVHLRLDETWRSCLQFLRKGLLDSHVALEFLSRRFISRFLHLHPFPSPSQLHGSSHLSSSLFLSSSSSSSRVWSF